MKKILLCTGEEQSFDSDMTMFYSNQYNIKNDVMFSTNTIINKVLRNAGFCFVRFAINHTLIEDLEKYDTLIIFESVVKISAIRYIRTKNPNIRIIIYFRNQFTFSKKRNVSLTYLKKYNCEFWSYHLGDCEKHHFQYNSQFWNPEYLKKIKPQKENTYDCLFLGRTKNRINDVVQIHEKLKHFQLKDYIYLVPKTNYDFDRNLSNQYMNYEHYLEKLSVSNAVLDLVNTENYGLTLRPLEALFYNKKVITNYREIKLYDFYNKNNIFVIGEDSVDNLNDFLKKPYIELPNNIVESYTFDKWISRFFK